MKQLLQNMQNGETLIAEVPVPAVRPGCALVQTAVSLVSAGTERMLVEFAGKSLLGKAQSRPDLVRQLLDKARREGILTTLEAAFSRLEQPLALGYSSAGTIIALGSGLKGFRVGDRVACGGGGSAVHAEFAVVPQNLLAALPDSVSFEEGAFATLASIALHGFRLSGVQVGEKVAVIGLGLLGLLTVEIARAAGCSVLGIDINPQRVSLARQVGAEDAVARDQAEEAAQAFSRGAGMDAVIICADSKSADPVELAGLIARDRAKVVAVGAVSLEIPRKLYYEKELDFLVSRSYGPGRYDPAYEEQGRDYPQGYVRWTEGRNMQAIVDLIASRRVSALPLITHRFPIDEANQAYDLITGKHKTPFLGVLITYPQTALADRFDNRIPSPTATTVSAHPGEMLALGVIGAGNFANAVFLPAVRRAGGVAPVGIASASGLNAQNAARRYGFGYSTSGQDQIFSDPAINIVAVLTRHNSHAALVQAALTAGKHAFCEKPLAITPGQLAEVEEMLKQPGRPLLTVGFNRRFAPFSRRLKEFIDGRRDPLFATYRINASRIPLSHWLHDPQVGGGRLIGEACHFVDYLVFLVGEAPRSLSIQTLPDENRYHEDNIQITLAFPDGSLGTIQYLANGDKTFPKERLEVFCGGRVGVLDDFRALELTRNGKRQAYHSLLRQDKGHQAGWEAFLTSIRIGGPAPIPYEQVLAVHRACFTAVEALHTAPGTLVTIPSGAPVQAQNGASE